MADKGDTQRARASTLISRYLNDWEDFCGAISVGVVDENYARSMEGGRLIDAFFGYRKVIEERSAGLLFLGFRCALPSES